MSAAALLAELRAAGAELTVDPQGVRFKAPRPLPAALLARARASKLELRRLLEQPVDLAAGPAVDLAQFARLEAPGPELPPDVDPADPAAPAGTLPATPGQPAGNQLAAPEAPAELLARHPDTPEAWAAFLDEAPWVGPAERLRILADARRLAAGTPEAPSPEPSHSLLDPAGAALEAPAGLLTRPRPPLPSAAVPPFRWGSVLPLAPDPPRAPHRLPHPLGDRAAPPSTAAPSRPSSPPRPPPPVRPVAVVDPADRHAALSAALVAQLGPVRGVAPLAPPSPDVSPGAAAAWREACQRRLAAGLDVETAERLTNTTHGPRPE